MQRIIKILLLSIVLGLVGLGGSTTREPWGVWDGFPFPYAYPNPITCLPNPFNGCGFYYVPFMVVLDYLFWFGMAVVGVSVVSLLWNRLGPISSPIQPANDQIPPGNAALTKSNLLCGIRPDLVVSKITFGSAVDLGFRSELLASDARYCY